ncbi:bifunctional diaminohydroxyphosphoribosylaminopyrimidine deaminase/5-amino-6-(5-phosphoribosylamino)uracil reductase RibD [Pseudalkalibacillus hwajinpoensis]|uniref:Riboflavin biosynthesis protein RibD n=1 Tax=Guptibacillus hwajinpoensis TaxID=208199 RepID=A0A4U1MG01_9BACL|nr:bifunctional diaminohydroxyphosphoribosylaminopyrimidine deaminase/5-amino-6-(5-phosphoribosylamino)uracil reductase RibD [Pseudalkalibacillus hwajinpoensis]TKD69244.1 bifunctional diaminohydroxyphosphoribosylaminopyrimidine deaminase/5-amino-6-(5-phosphoribosylamino)uracil reductase RibD [Pseudalkalibacillus hwajinpoensis]
MNNEYYMNFAINLAKYTKGQTNPNPPVGAVLVKNNQIVGYGTHLFAGGSHAERVAIEVAGEQAEGSTLFLTLEPCNHHGKTPPCTDLIIEKGIKKVVIGAIDPNPQVSSKGIKKLKSQGIKVEVGILENECNELLDAFSHYITTKRPYVTIKTAVSLDGKMATAYGESKWISNAESRKDTHTLRHESSAILVGVETVIKDNPSLTSRLEFGGKNPIRIILDSDLRIPLSSKVLTDNEATTIILTRKENDNFYLGTNVKVVGLENGPYDISEVVNYLGEQQIMSLLVEGGAKVISNFMKSRIYNRVIVYEAPIIIGGEGLSPFQDFKINSISQSLEYDLKEVKQIKDNIKKTFIKKEELYATN